MAVLVYKSVSRTLVGMAFPMLAGTFAMNAYNLTDTWFVSRLGTIPLAAMGFTFPIVMLLTCVARGIGSGVTALASHAIGRHDQAVASRLVSHGTMLTLAITAVMSFGGYLLITPIFTRLGAGDQTLPLIGEYMRTWYVGAVFMTLPMLGHGVLISVGDSKAVSQLMIAGTVLNVILDPILIFGYFGCPAMGVRGAALATVIAQGVSMVWLLHLLLKKHRLLTWGRWRFSEYTQSFGSIMRFAVPSILSMILMPISATVITKLLSEFGHATIAATGAAVRIEMFAFMVPMALGMSLTPFVSQNFGADRMDRVRQAHKFAIRFAMGYGSFVAVVFFLAAPWLAAAFTDDPAVARTLVSYIRIIPFGYGMMEVHRYCGFFLTGMYKPISAALLNVVRVLILLLPLSFLGMYFWGVIGVFAGRLVTDLVAGLIGITWVAYTLKKVRSTEDQPIDRKAVPPGVNAETGFSAGPEITPLNSGRT
jgi:putative MATE family efflux protein